MSPAPNRAHIVAVTAALAVAALVHGLSMPLLSIVLDRQGVDSTLIGINTAVQYLSVIAIAPFAPRLMGHAGLAAVMLWGILGMAALFLILPLVPNVWAWFPLRFLLGVGGSFLWIAGEAWVNHVTEERVRGRVLAIYGMVAAGGFALGPLVLTVTGTEGWLPFLASAAIIAAAGIPLLAVLGTSPRLDGERSSSLAGYVRLAPVAMLVYLAFSATDGILLTFLPLYGMASGISEDRAVVLISAMALGALALQWPIGWLADHMNRMLLTLLALVACAAGACVLPAVIAHSPWNAAFMFGFGGVLGALYTVPLTQLGQRFKGADLAAAATVFGIMFNLGSILGPPLGGLGMELFGPHGLPGALALIFLAFVPLAAWGYARGRSA